MESLSQWGWGGEPQDGVRDTDSSLGFAQQRNKFTGVQAWQSRWNQTNTRSGGQKRHWGEETEWIQCVTFGSSTPTQTRFQINSTLQAKFICEPSCLAAADSPGVERSRNSDHRR